jgi:uncharacterized protein YdeI (YjbR/CyaY-like superfamily)
VEVVHFKTIGQLRQWFRKHGGKQTELWIGFYRKELQLQGVSYSEALDEALCWGWIDGVRKRVDEESYTNRFTPRKPRSIWSRVNISHVERLKEQGRMQPTGIAAFEARTAERSGVYSFEQEKVEFEVGILGEFRKNKKAWSYFQEQPPGYRRVATHWIMSAKRPETRLRRLMQLMDACQSMRRLGVLSGKKDSSSEH